MGDAAVSRPEGFDRLTQEERVRYVLDLWDEVMGVAEDVPSPDWHAEVVDEALDEHRRRPDDVVDAFEFVDSLRRTLSRK